jgi:SAM-dependent methyltransferase
MSDTLDSPVAQKPPDYWSSRQNAFYYRNVLELLCGMARDAKSALDVGSRNTPILESCHWIKERVCVDISKPYSSKAVTGIKIDFFDYKPAKKFDVAICLQVLEHIDDAPAFARKLFDVAKRARPFRLVVVLQGNHEPIAYRHPGVCCPAG